MNLHELDVDLDKVEDHFEKGFSSFSYAYECDWCFSSYHIAKGALEFVEGLYDIYEAFETYEEEYFEEEIEKEAEKLVLDGVFSVFGLGVLEEVFKLIDIAWKIYDYWDKLID